MSLAQTTVIYRASDGEGQAWDVLDGLTLGPCSIDAMEDALPERQWSRLSPYFQPVELACRGTAQVCVYLPALIAYNRLRADGVLRAHSPTSAYRSPEHNRRVGGSPASRHLAGAAFDVPRTAFAVSEDALIMAARKAGFNGFGRYQSFIHMDFRARPADWTG